MELNPRISLWGSKKVGRAQFFCFPLFWRSKCDMFDNVKAQWLQSEMKSTQTVEPFQASKRQPDIIITFSQWAKGLARLQGGVGWEAGERRKEANLPGAHKDTWREMLADLCQSKCVRINPSADGCSTVQHVNCKRDSISKPPCWKVSQRITLGHYLTCWELIYSTFYMLWRDTQ